MAKTIITRTIDFPIDLYDELKKQALLQELPISKLIIKALREKYNVPVRIEE